jgi:hypothetical protein
MIDDMFKLTVDQIFKQGKVPSSMNVFQTKQEPKPSPFRVHGYDDCLNMC